MNNQAPDKESIILRTIDLSREIVKNGRTIKTVDDVTFEFKKGSIYNIVGPSGAGKSSYLRLLNRLDEPTGGEVYFNGKPVSDYNPTELRRKIALLFQTPYLFEGTVLDNLNFCCPERNLGNPEYHLERVGLSDRFKELDVEELSVGEKQRVAIARSLLLQPEILLLDEPTSALDPSNAQKIEQLILQLAGDLNLTGIIVTHNPDQALRLEGTTLLLVSGRLVEHGTSRDVLTSPQTELGRKYINKELL
jgi:putative ABC transport system ATP-binding protein